MIIGAGWAFNVSWMVGVWWAGHVYNIPKVVPVTHVNWPSERAPEWLSSHYTSVGEDEFKWTIKCKCRQFILEIVFVMPSPAVCHTTAAGPGKSTTTTTDFSFLSLFFPLFYTSPSFAGLMVCVSCSAILQDHRSRSHQSVCIIIRVLDRSGTQTCF